MKSIPFLLMSVLLASTAFAQEKPRPGGEPFDGPPPFNGPGPGNRGGPGMQGGMGGNPMMMQVELMRGWLDLIERYARLARDPVASGVAAVVSADDLLKGKPPEQAIEYFTKLLSEVKNESVQR